MQYVSLVARGGGGEGKADSSSSVSPWFLRFEITFLQRIIEAFLVLQRSIRINNVNVDIAQNKFIRAEETFHLVALKILPRLSDTSTVFKFIQSVVFSKYFVKDFSSSASSVSPASSASSTQAVADSMDVLHLENVDIDGSDTDVTPAINRSIVSNDVSNASISDFRLLSAAGDDISVSRQRLQQLTEENLNQIRGSYMDSLASIVALSGAGEGGVASLVRDRSTNLLTKDWMYLPLVQSYQRCVKLESKGEIGLGGRMEEEG